MATSGSRFDIGDELQLAIRHEIGLFIVLLGVFWWWRFLIYTFAKQMRTARLHLAIYQAAVDDRSQTILRHCSFIH